MDYKQRLDELVKLRDKRPSGKLTMPFLHQTDIRAPQVFDYMCDVTVAFPDAITLAEEVVAEVERLNNLLAIREANYDMENRLGKENEELHAEVERLNGLINTPELQDFMEAIKLEAAHQRERWGEAHDTAKDVPDWFWLIGYVCGKAMNAWKNNNHEKLLHHIITTAAVCLNWHRHAKATYEKARGGE